jgi:hypothetical protein
MVLCEPAMAKLLLAQRGAIFASRQPSRIGIFHVTGIPADCFLARCWPCLQRFIRNRDKRYDETPWSQSFLELLCFFVVESSRTSFKRRKLLKSHSQIFKRCLENWSLGIQQWHCLASSGSIRTACEVPKPLIGDRCKTIRPAILPHSLNPTMPDSLLRGVSYLRLRCSYQQQWNLVEWSFKIPSTPPIT